VTTFLHGHFDHFDSDKIIAGILKNSVETDRRTKYFGKTKEDSGGVECECAFASAARTNIHYDIECFYNGLEPDNTSIEYEY
jgi:hypothetical protein